MSSLSNSGVQFCPASIVFQTPPATPPKYQVSGSPGTPSIASARPPRNGPTWRHCIPLKSFSSNCAAGAGAELAVGVELGVGTPGPPPRVGVCLAAKVLAVNTASRATTKANQNEMAERKVDL